MNEQLALMLADPSENREGARHREATDTERAAAKRAGLRSGTWRRRVLNAIAASRDKGLTDFEIHERTGGRLYTVAPRRKELVDMGWVRDSGRRRATDSGSLAIVWMLTEQGLLDLARLVREERQG